MFTPELDKALSELIEQWNTAEHRIKMAEQVRGGEVVASAIFELRYAARKLVDAITVAHNTDLTTDSRAREDIHKFLADATEDCVKAKHDAIDAMMNFVTRWFNETEEFLGLKWVTEFFPDYLEQTSKIESIQKRIAESREDRTKLRDAIYNDIEKDGYPAVLALYQRMLQSKDRVAAAVKNEKTITNWDRIFVIAGVVISLAALVVALVH